MFQAPGKLHVVTAVFNPQRYRSRYRLYREFARRCEDAGVVLYTVEAGFHRRDYEVTSADNPRHVQVRTSDELWVKENLWNVGIARLPHDAEYVATVDADFQFTRPDWADETVHQLQHHAIVQMFTNVAYLDPGHVVVRTPTPGFAFAHRHINNFFAAPSAVGHTVFAGQVNLGYEVKDALAVASPGGAWAYRRSALSEVGGLLDFMILGACDYYMALALTGAVEASKRLERYHPAFRQLVIDWQYRADRAFRRNLGFVTGTAIHYWHGRHADRRYIPREEILIREQFNPLTDLKRDIYGVYQLHDDGSVRFTRLRDAIRDYFRLRNEDSIDM